MELHGPFLALPTKRGAVPTLTPAQSSAILEPSERIVATSVFDAIDFVKPCGESKMPMTAFCGLEGYTTVLTLRSSFQGAHCSAASTDAAVAGDNEKGRAVVSMEKWCEVVRATQPEMAVEPHESVALSEPLSKRRRVAATRSETWQTKLEAAAAELRCTLIPSISLGNEHSSGFIDAVPRNENALELFRTLQALKLPASGLSMCVAHTVPALVAALVSNVRLIECPLPWMLAEKGIAVVFPACGGDADGAEAEAALLDFNDNAFTLDISPISATCPCYTYARHNRAYMHHLLTVQEMNSDILLCIHNLSQFVHLVRAFRHAGADERVAIARRVLSAF